MHIVPSHYLFSAVETGSKDSKPWIPDSGEKVARKRTKNRTKSEYGGYPSDLPAYSGMGLRNCRGTLTEIVETIGLS